MQFKKLLCLALLLFTTPLTAIADALPQVVVATSMGKFTLELYPEKAPKTVANFLRYVDDGFYDGTLFHRVIDGFMIQGGGFTNDMQRKATRGTIGNEADNGLHNELGTIAMARTGDPHSATSQFFINLANNTHLDHSEPTRRGWGYTVFGRCIEGMATVEKIKAVPTKRQGPYQNVPVEPIIIKSMKQITH